MNLTQATILIDQMTFDLAEANDAAERRAALDKALADVQERRTFLQRNHREILPHGICGDAAVIEAKLAALRAAGL